MQTISTQTTKKYFDPTASNLHLILFVGVVRKFHILCALTFLACATASAIDSLPFKFRDGFIWIEVSRAGASRPMSFILDSGAQMSVIDEPVAERLGAKQGRRATVMGVGSLTCGRFAEVSGLSAGSIKLSPHYLVTDLSKLGIACTNGLVDGILGADFFRGRIVEIDFENEQVRLLPESSIRDATEILPLQIRREGMLIPAKVNGSSPQWVRLDTGCASALHWVCGDLRPEGGHQRVAIALNASVISVTQTDLVLGATRFEQIRTDLHERELFRSEKGLLGNGVLSQFRTVTIDAKEKRVVFGALRDQKEAKATSAAQ